MPDPETTAALARALRKQGARLNVDRNHFFDECEQLWDLVGLLGGELKRLMADNEHLEAKNDRLQSLNRKLLKKCNELTKAQQ
jgi:hypothetical protein